MSRRVAAVLSVIALALMLGGCASIERFGKNVQSDFSGGIERTVTVYSLDGNQIAQWHGKIDYQYDNGRVLFDMDGKRYSVIGGIVVTEEGAYEQSE